MKKLLSLLVVLFALMLAVGCGKPIEIVSLGVSGEEEVEVGATFALEVEAEPAGTPVEFKSSDPNVLTVDANGNVKAVGAGTATITVTLTEHPDTSVEIEIVVKENPLEGVMTYAEYMAAELDTQVIVAAFVQGKQIYADAYGNTSLYLQDNDGGYFVYRWACTQEEYDAIKLGAFVKVTGTKAAWSGEVEIKDAKVEVVEGPEWLAEATDVTSLIGKDTLIDHQNKFVAMKGLVVEAKALYKYNGSGDRGDDLYLDVSYEGKKYTYVVESDYQTKDSDVYKAVEALVPGDIIDLEGILYWYNGAQPHLSKVTVKGNVNTKSSGTMTHAEYLATADDNPVVIEAYIQGKQIYADLYKNTTLYLQDKDGGYFVYRWSCTQEEYDALKVGDKIKVTGTKASWSGEIEITSATVEKVEGHYIAPALDVTNLLDSEDLINYQNQYVYIKGAKVAASFIKGDETEYPFLYKYNGSGDRGDDIYYTVTVGEVTLTLVVESDYQTADSDCYKAAEAMKVGDTIDIYAILYWYNGAQPHTSEIVVK